MLQALSDSVQIFDPTGHLIYANEATAAALGYSTLADYWQDYQAGHQTLAATFRNLEGMPLGPEHSPFLQAQQGHMTREQVLYYVDRSGRDRCAAVQVIPIRDDAGSLQYGVVISRDLTELQLTQQAFHQRTQQLYQITDAVPSLIAYLDCQERHQYANAAYLRVFNQTLEAVQGRELQSVLGPVLYQQLQEAVHQALQGTFADLCLPLVSQAHPTQYKHVNIIPQRRGDVVEGIYLVMNDITAHKHTTDLLQNETNFFRHALEAAAVGIWDWDLSRDEIMWSQPQEQLFGMTPGSFDGRPATFFALVHPEDQERIRQALSLALQPRQTFSVDFRVQLQNRTQRWLSHRGQVFRDAMGQAIRIAGVAFDITHQKEAEAKLLLQVKRDQLVARISQDISRSHNLQEVLPQVVQDVRTFLGVDRLVIIDLQEKMAGEITYEAHHPQVNSMLEWKLRHTWAVKDKFLEKYRQGYPIAVSNIQNQPLHDAEMAFLNFFQISADLTVPLLEENQLWGLLSAHHSTPRDWQPDERRLLETLGTLVSTAIQRDKLHRHLTQANEKLKRFAYLDGLTQVANRRRFEQYLHHEWRRLMREQTPLALIMADIDYFKAYNDIYGHQAGDECLRRVAGTLRSAIQRPADMVARYGGEEFAVVLPNTNLAGAETVAEKIRLMVRKQKIPHEGSPVSQIITLSLGVAAFCPHPLKAPDDLIQSADDALYRAKGEGRDRVVSSSSPLSQ
jgi:diguanylate cyclase (GGDEF)-like protein/PAS domain S-box-containing protein